MHAVTFNTGGISLTADTQYVLFVTTSRDPAANAGIQDTGCFGYTFIDTYGGGDWVYQDDGGDPTQWTAKGWTYPSAFPLNFPNQDDLGFTATFSSHKNPPSGP
jgi:hypothetical protein